MNHTSAEQGRLDFSLFFFAQDSDARGQQKYHLLLEAARFADTHGFAAVWTPERHFHAFGGSYPNPSVVGAALAVLTRTIQIRAGSVVLPLQDPLRVAEEWAVVDNLSGGRVGLALASGAGPDDFVLAPDVYGQRKEVMERKLEELRRLWRGQPVRRTNGAGRQVDILSRPRPVQAELPLWLTSAGTPETFARAGRQGMGLLTHLLGQDLRSLSEKISLYRRSWREAGHPGRGRVALMLHTFVHPDMEHVRSVVRAPFRRYLASSLELLEGAHGTRELGDFVTPEDREALVDFGYERYFHTSGLFGTPTHCLEQVQRLRELDVDEAACLIDFGIADDEVLGSLSALAELMRLSAR